MTVGRNTLAGEQLRSFVERIEAIREQKRQLSADESAVKAEAKANGFNTVIVGHIIRRRAAKPHDVQEHDALMDLYQHALGMLPEPPLFRAVGMAEDDQLVRETIIERMKAMVPPGGEIIVKIGSPMRIWRDKEGNAYAEDYAERPAGPEPHVAGRQRQRPPAPDANSDEAFALGERAARENRAVIDNPFPFGDARRAKWDEGWRKQTGSDGMGPGG
ncbi:MAG: DUF2312 domain-containing protein [Phycisphaeraceae bacterium]